ncbi:MAG: heavy metal-associated domain-containing protein [Dysgonamonadaceae bacterium]
MKIEKLLIVLINLALCFSLSANDKQKDEKNKKDISVTFVVNMVCENCKAKIQKNISWEKGVKDLKVNLEEKTVSIRFNPEKTTEEKLKQAIEKLGYSCHPKN